MRRLALAFVSLFVVGTAACAGSGDGADNAALANGADQEQNRATTILEAKLYPDARERPSPSCDVHTAVKVTKAHDGKLTLALENRIAGGCELFVNPDPRSYTVTQSDDGCGSTLFQGASHNDSIVLTDHRARACENVIPAAMELEEKRGEQGDLRLYGESAR
jgi:hypothetical protein